MENDPFGCCLRTCQDLQIQSFDETFFIGAKDGFATLIAMVSASKRCNTLRDSQIHRETSMRPF
jgi:hypothetical protein